MGKQEHRPCAPNPTRRAARVQGPRFPAMTDSATGNPRSVMPNKGSKSPRRACHPKGARPRDSGQHAQPREVRIKIKAPKPFAPVGSTIVDWIQARRSGIAKRASAFGTRDKVHRTQPPEIHTLGWNATGEDPMSTGTGSGEGNPTPRSLLIGG
jgi:hypothetical protein